MWKSGVVATASFAVINFCPNFGELCRAIIGRRFVWSCFAKDRFTSICGIAVKARLMVGIIWLVRGECLILKKVFCGVDMESFGVVRIFAIRTLRKGSYLKYVDRSISA